MENIDYGRIIKRSWQITLKNKWLWVMGLVLATFSFGGGTGYSGSSLTGNIPKDLPREIPSSLPEETSQVLGQSINFIKTWLGQISPLVWFLLGGGIILVVLVWIVVRMIAKAWAKGALITGLEEADGEKEVTLSTTSPSGKRAIKNLIILGIISFFITLGIFLGLGLLVGFGYLIFSFSDFLKNFWLILVGALGILSFCFFLVLLAMLNVYSERLIVLRNYSPWEAWKRGLGLAYHHFFPTLIMGIVNQALGCTLGCLTTMILLLILGVPGALLVWAAIKEFKDGFQWADLRLVLGVVLLVFIFFCLNILIRAIILVFNYGVWNLFFKEIILKEENE